MAGSNDNGQAAVGSWQLGVGNWAATDVAVDLEVDMARLSQDPRPRQLICKLLAEAPSDKPSQELGLDGG